MTINLNDDDMWERFMEANGISRLGWEQRDGGWRLRAFRADGSELDWSKAYGANAKLTPYTATKGNA